MQTPKPLSPETYRKTIVSAAQATLERRLFCLKALRPCVPAMPLSPLALVPVPLTVTTAAAEKDSTNLEASTFTSDVKDVTVNGYTVSFQPDQNAQLYEHYLADVATNHAESLADGIMDCVGALLTVGNFGTITPAADGLSGADLKALFAALPDKATKALVLSPLHYSNLAPAELRNITEPAQAGGFDAVYKNSRWPATVGGFATGPRSLAIAAGLPAPVNTPVVETGNFVLSCGVPVVWTMWLKPGSRKPWVAFETMFGAAVGIAAEGKLIGTGATS